MRTLVHKRRSIITFDITNVSVNTLLTFNPEWFWVMEVGKVRNKLLIRQLFELLEVSLDHCNRIIGISDCMSLEITGYV